MRRPWSDYLLPPYFLEKYRKIRAAGTTVESRPQVQEWNRNRLPRSDRLFVLASGPSINQVDLRLLLGKDIMAVSFFHAHPMIGELKPLYHVLAPQHPPFNFGDSSKYFEAFLRVYGTWTPDIYLGVNNYEFSFERLIESRPDFASLPVYFMRYDGSPELNEQNYRDPTIWNPRARPFQVRTVVYQAIQVAADLGYKEICLLGVDHDYLADVTRVSNHHFYDDKDGISDVQHLSLFTKERWFLEYHLRWKQYRLMKDYLEQRGTKVLNLNRSSYLDVFEFADLENLV